MKKPFFYTFLAIFAATAALTLLGMADVVKIRVSECAFHWSHP